MIWKREWAGWGWGRGGVYGAIEGEKRGRIFRYVMALVRKVSLPHPYAVNAFSRYPELIYLERTVFLA